MKRPLASPAEINRLYDEWECSRGTVALDSLLKAVMDTTFRRFSNIDGEDAADEIAAQVGAKLYRALPGYRGPSPLKPYDPLRGKFSAYQSTLARTTRLNYVTRKAASGAGEEELVYGGSDGFLESLYHVSQGGGNTRREPITEENYLLKRDPKCRIAMGNSAWNQQDS